jgi:hypothetical protein
VRAAVGVGPDEVSEECVPRRAVACGPEDSLSAGSGFESPGAHHEQDEIDAERMARLAVLNPLEEAELAEAAASPASAFCTDAEAALSRAGAFAGEQLADAYTAYLRAATRALLAREPVQVLLEAVADELTRRETISPRAAKALWHAHMFGSVRSYMREELEA